MTTPVMQTLRRAGQRINAEAADTRRARMTLTSMLNSGSRIAPWSLPPLQRQHGSQCMFLPLALCRYSYLPNFTVRDPRAAVLA